jgi:hypothetical protein
MYVGEEGAINAMRARVGKAQWEVLAAVTLVIMK